MAIEGLQLNPGAGGDQLAVDTINSKKHQLVKIEFGVDGSQTMVSASNPLPVDLGSNNDVTVTGTVTANAGTGTFTVDGSGVTQPISAASLPLPTGAATETTLTDRTQLTKITDGASDIALATVGAVNTIPVTLWGGTGSLLAPAGLLSVLDNNSPGIKTAVESIDGKITAVDTTNLALDASVTGMSAKLPATLGQKTKATALGVTLASDEDAIAASQSGAWTVTANAGSNLDTSGLALESGGNLAAIAGAVSGSEMQVDVVAALPAGSNTVGKVGLDPQTSGGLDTHKTISAASTNSTNVKNAAGQLFGYYVHNENAAWRYLKIYDKATAPTIGTDTPVLTIPIVPGGAANVEFTNGIEFTAGIGFGLTTGIADSDTAAVAANEIAVNLVYK